MFTPSELDTIQNSWDLLWLHWAAKEAAYKAFKRIDSALVFSPKRYQFNIDAATVLTPNGIAYCRWIVTRDFVHVGCATRRYSELQQLKSWTVKIAEDGKQIQPKRHSTCARQLAVQKVAQELNLSEQELRIGSDRKGVWSSIPLLEVNGHSSKYLISLSHDGRFVSFTLQL